MRLRKNMKRAAAAALALSVVLSAAAPAALANMEAALVEAKVV